LGSLGDGGGKSGLLLAHGRDLSAQSLGVLAVCSGALFVGEGHAVLPEIRSRTLLREYFTTRELSRTLRICPLVAIARTV